MLIALAILLGLGWPVSTLQAEEKAAIHIAVVGPLTGKTAAKGQSIQRGVQLYIDEYNQTRKEGTKAIVLDFYDDQNNPDLAKQMATKIVSDDRAVAVIGHNYSSSSKQGGPIYLQHRIPAISPTSTDVAVTKDNPWYFRTVFNDALQGRFLANYTTSVLESDNVAIISEDLSYGRFLADTFEQTSRALGSPVQYRGEIVVGDKNMEERIDAIVADLKLIDNLGTIFLAAHATEGVSIVQKVRDAGLTSYIITPDSFASKSFQEGFNDLPKEATRIGHYTNGIYVTTPLIFDTANEKAQIFREKFSKAFLEEPDWTSAFSYDSAMLLVRAIVKSQVEGSPITLAEDRQKIRDYLASLDRPGKAVEGVTGFNFFDENGDAQKPISIGKFQNRSIISAATQLQTVKNLDELEGMDEQEIKERVILVENNQMHRVNVVFVGFHVNKVENLDLKLLTCDLDLYLWFRFRGEMDVKQIVFLNALSSIEFGEPEEQMEVNRTRYQRYHIRGKFRADFLAGGNTLRNHVLGLNFRHDKLPRTNLIFVNDVLGMKLGDQENPADDMNRDQVLGPGNKWLVSSVRTFQDVVSKQTYGSLYHLNTQQKIDFSRFNVAISIRKDEVSLRGAFSPELSEILLYGSGFILFIALLRRRIRGLRKMHKLFWFLTSITLFVALLAGEVVLTEWLSSRTTPNNLALVVFSFNVLWWLAWAFVINLATENFLWEPMERKTGQIIPKIIRRFLSYGVFTLASFGIIAFVFDQKLTSLLATSGMIAMIIGLAIQANISNIFSGIAINVERPFRIGDWVIIGDLKEGRVEDITWRSTKIRNRDGSISRIPNGIVSEATIQNFTDPDSVVETWIYIELDPKHPPGLVETVMTDTLFSIPEVVKDPAPFTSFHGVEGWAARYLLGFTIKDYNKKPAVRKKITKKIWEDLHLAGFTFATPRRTLITKDEEILFSSPFPARQVLEKVGLYDHLPDTTKQRVEDGSIVETFTAGTTIASPNGRCDSIIVVLQGVGSIQVEMDGGAATEIKRLGAGGYFGEMAVLDGGQRNAGVVALTDTRVVQITREDLLYMFEQKPHLKAVWTDILTHSSSSAAEKKEYQQKKLTAKETAHQKGLFKGIKRLFAAS